jgi:hypothetical protein
VNAEPPSTIGSERAGCCAVGAASTTRIVEDSWWRTWNARLRVTGSIYELVASRVDGQDEFDRSSDAYERKYGKRPRHGNVAEAYLFRLRAR